MSPPRSPGTLSSLFTRPRSPLDTTPSNAAPEARVGGSGAPALAGDRAPNGRPRCHRWRLRRSHRSEDPRPHSPADGRNGEALPSFVTCGPGPIRLRPDSDPQYLVGRLGNARFIATCEPTQTQSDNLKSSTQWNRSCLLIPKSPLRSTPFHRTRYGPNAPPLPFVGAGLKPALPRAPARASSRYAALHTRRPP